MLIAFLVLLAAQEPIDELVRRLGSGDIDGRERAVVELALRGEEARSALERAAGGMDAEAASRARVALARLPLTAAVTPAAETAFPGLRARLASGRAPADLPRALLRAPATLGRLDLLPLARPALELAATHAERSGLLRVIADRRLDSAVPAFVALLDIDEWTVRQSLFDAIDACRAQALVPELLARLRSTRSDRWIWAAPLGRLGCRDIIPILVAEILTPTGQHGPSLQPLVDLDAIEAAPALLRRLIDTRQYDNGELLQAVQRIAPDLLRPALHAALEDPNLDRRSRAWQLLVDRLNSRSALPQLRKRLDDPDPRVRADAASKIGQFRRAEFIPELRNTLEDDVPSVRQAAALALAQLGRADGLGEILPLLNQPQRSLSAASALAGLGLREHGPAVLRAARESPERAWFTVHLATLGVAEARPIILDVLQDANDRQRDVATWSLAKLDGLQALPALRQLLKNDDRNIAWSAFRHMIELLPAEVILDDVRAWTRDPDMHTRGQALWHLVRLRPDEARPLVVRELDAEHTHARGQAAGLAARLKAVEAIPRLKALLLDGDPYPRQEAALALVRLGDPAGVAFAVGSYDLNALNIVRRPRLRDKKLSGAPVVGIHAFAERAGLKVEGEDDVMRSEERTVEVEGRDLLSVFLDCAPAWAVLEEDRVRLLNEREARRFWKRWAAEEKLLPDPERALAELDARREVPPLEDGATTRLFLESKNPALAAAALRGAISPEEILKVLALAVKKPGVREQLPALLKHAAAAVRLAAARALLLTDEAAGVPLVVPLLDDPAVKTDVVKLLGEQGRREANAEILKRMEDPAIMWGLAYAAGQLQLKEAMPALLKAIEPGEYYFGRMFAVSQIRQLGDPSLAPRLRDALRIEKDPQVTYALIGALGAWGHREAMPEIVDTLINPRNLLSHYAGEAFRVLDQLGVKDVGLARALLENPATQDVAALALADWGDVESLPGLRKLPRASVSLALLGDQASVPLLRERLNDENHMVMWAAAKALAMMGDRPSYARILEKSESPDTWRLLRTHEARTKLASKGCEIDTASPEYLPLLRPWLSNEHPSMRAQATRAVGRLDGAEALELTRSMLLDPADEVRRAANDTLARREWARLGTWEGPFYGPASVWVARLAKKAGLKLEDLPEDSPVGPTYRKVYVRVRAGELPLTGADLVYRIPRAGWRLALDGDTLRVRSER